MELVADPLLLYRQRCERTDESEQKEKERVMNWARVGTLHARMTLGPLFFPQWLRVSRSQTVCEFQ
jgi:hypothetical protein